MADDVVFKGRIELDVDQALKEYTRFRQQHLSTVSALGAGAGALTAVGASFVAGGAAIAAGIGVAINAAAEFERKLDFFSAVSDSTTEEMEQIREKALQLGADTIYSADQIAESFIELGKSGVLAKDIIDGIGDAVANLGAAADIPLGDAANIVTGTLATFGLAAEDAVAVVDKLAGAANASTVDVQDLGVSLKYAGGVAASLGVPFEDVNTALALLGKRGIRGSTAGTSLRQVLLSLNGTTKKAKSALEELGIITEDGTNRFYDATGSAKPLAEVMQILKEATAGYSDERRTATLQDIFATRALPSLVALMDEGAAGFAEMQEIIGNTTAWDVAMERLDNLSGDLEILRGNFDTLVINIGATKQALARDLVQAITVVVDWLNSLDEKTLGWIVTIAGVLSAILIIVGLLGMFAGQLLNIYRLVIILAPAFTFLASAISAVIGPMSVLGMLLRAFPLAGFVILLSLVAGALAVFFTQTETGQKIFAQLMGLFEQGLAAVMPMLEQIVPLLTQFAQTIGGWLAEGLAAVMPLLTALGDFLIGVLGPILPVITQLFTNLGAVFSGISSGGGSGLSTLQDILGNLVVGFQSMIPIVITALVQLVTMILQTLVSIAPLVITGFLKLLTGIVKALTMLIPIVIPAVIQLITSILQIMVSLLPLVLTAALQLFTGLVEALVVILPVLVQGILQLILGIVNMLVTMLPLIIEGGLQLFMGLLDALIIVLPALIEALVAMIPTVAATLISMIPVILEAAIELFMALVEAIPEILPPLIEAVINILPTLIETVISLIPALLNAAIQLFTSLISALPRILPKLISAVINLVPKIISALIGLIPVLLQAAVKLFTAIVDAVPKIVNSLVSAMKTLGTDMINGLINGIKGMAQKAIDAVGSLVNGAINWAKSLLGQNSPSKVFRDIGMNTIKGMIIGMDSMERDLNNQMNMVATSVDDLYDQVFAARELDLALNLAAQADMTGNGISNQLALMNAQLTDIAAKDTFNVEKLEINNPEPEASSDSLPNAIRSTAYALG